jgi:hypothetical protein
MSMGFQLPKKYFPNDPEVDTSCSGVAGEDEDGTDRFREFPRHRRTIPTPELTHAQDGWNAIVVKPNRSDQPNQPIGRCGMRRRVRGGRREKRKKE